MKNQERYRMTSDCVFSTVQRIVKVAKTKDGESRDKVYGLFIDVKLTSCLQKGLNEVRKFYTLEKALRTLVNMVPEPTEEQLDG